MISFALDDSDDDFESMKSIMEEDDSFVASIGGVISLDKEQAEDYSSADVNLVFSFHILT